MLLKPSIVGYFLTTSKSGTSVFVGILSYQERKGRRGGEGEREEKEGREEGRKGGEGGRVKREEGWRGRRERKEQRGRKKREEERRNRELRGSRSDYLKTFSIASNAHTHTHTHQQHCNRTDVIHRKGPREIHGQNRDHQLPPGQ